MDQDQPSDEDKADQLIDTVCEETEDQSGDHLFPFRFVEEDARQPAEEDGEWNGHRARREEASDPCEVMDDRDERSKLPCHRSEDNSEVQSHTGKDGNDKGNDEERVSGEPRHEVVGDRKSVV